MRLKIKISDLFFYILISLQVFTPRSSFSDIFPNDFPSESKYRYNGGNIKTVNGKFYAYIVLLFNENPHFVNMIQKGAISNVEMSIEGFHIKEYKQYLASIQDSKLGNECRLILKIFLEPDQFNDSYLHQIEKDLCKRNIILKFYREGTYKGAHITLDYCIYGEKIKIDIKHPLFDFNDEMYYIMPYIDYGELSTSNSTFYPDMIYINPDEVNDDYLIAQNVTNGKDVKSMFFVGSKVSDDIKHCLLVAFKENSSIKKEIWKMFVIHEITHKIMNNKFNNYDQVTGEELSLSSTIYSNPYLGLAVMYSYLNYSKMNPHKIAAMRFITYISEDSGNKNYINNPGSIKNIPVDKLKEFSKNYFHYRVSKLERDR